MAMIVKIDSRSLAAKNLLAFLKTLPFVKIEDSDTRDNSTTEKAIKDATTGIRITKTSSHSDLLKKLKS